MRHPALALSAALSLMPMASWAQSEVEVRISSGDAVLAGTLALPKDPPRAAVVLIQGAGPHGRNQVISRAPMFKELADGLAQQGIASLRIDNAGVGASTGQRVQHFKQRQPHIIATFDALAERPELQNVPLGLIGHSEGTLVASSIWADRKDAIDFMVMLGAPGRQGRAVWVEQQSNPARFPDHGPEDHQRLRAAFDAIAEASIAADRAAVTAAVDHLFELVRATPEEIAENKPGFIDRMASPEMQVWLSHDPAPVFGQITDPTLLVWGDADSLTSPVQNLPVFLAEKNPAAEMTFIVLPNEDHFFLRGEGLAPGQHRAGAMSLSPAIVTTVSDWIAAQARE
ncbi:alpha/beta fold hydrolase [Brevundimonas naejangsanensis]|uniref:Alpha/beta fold hydrolase n=1 Tax=Brevundimonas naejangsanensis TaxID=588932 RepID=A0A494RGY2_9CAUL|nr:alpha/beta fold hydrolase [Brevundimonas naejangsanensis]AYG95668.1 alpha/beta fold hydrolase [Brevundimonas naejangsanensis]